ncbi:MAG: hypothetical protein II625_11095 [Bacilli bacterium]|nr:hypothetical protein [Bacilli bacterium]
MKKKYIISLALIALLLVATLSVGTGYGVWLSSKQVEETNTKNIECFKIYYENDGIIEISKIKPVINSDGEETSPYTITITNTCVDPKEVQIRLNTVETTTIDVNALVLKTSGNIALNASLYKNLETTKTAEEGIKTSKLIGKVTIEPNETIRTNIRIWFDEKKAPIVDDTNNYFKGHIEVISSDSAIKPTLHETILKDKASIDAKAAPDFNEAAFNEEGLFAIDAANGKYYYYRGVVNNNFIKFSNNLWRIMGVNADGSIRLILETPISISKYSNNHKYADYAGLKYDYDNRDVNNEVLNTLESWYSNNITDDADEYILETAYCNDSSSRSAGSHIYFGAYDRLVTNITPSIICPNTKSDFGGAYNLKVSLITADEVALAGGVKDVNNYNYYLYNGTSFFTASPAEYYGNTSYLMVVTSSGSIGIDKTDSEQGIRPVINIVGNVTYTGSGTRENPYILD